MIIKTQGGGKVYANTGSCSDVVSYLQHEDAERLQKGQTQETFFNQEQDRISPKEVTSKIDNNRKGLKAKEAKFYVITVAPSRDELRKMGATKEEQAAAMKDYIRTEVMPKYADGFNKGLKAGDLEYYGKIHFERHEKDGEDLHAHIVVSHKTKNNGKSISPMTNHTGKKKTGAAQGGFERKEWFSSCEKAFDKRFDYDRNVKESFEYKNAMKNGTPKEMQEQVNRAIQQEQQRKQVQQQKPEQVQEVQREIKQEQHKNRGLKL
jgi:hypothetical protein